MTSCISAPKGIGPPPKPSPRLSSRVRASTRTPTLCRDDLQLVPVPVLPADVPGALRRGVSARGLARPPPPGCELLLLYVLELEVRGASPHFNQYRLRHRQGPGPTRGTEIPAPIADSQCDGQSRRSRCLQVLQLLHVFGP